TGKWTRRNVHPSFPWRAFTHFNVVQSYFGLREVFVLPIRSVFTARQFNKNKRPLVFPSIDFNGSIVVGDVVLQWRHAHAFVVPLLVDAFSVIFDVNSN